LAPLHKLLTARVVCRGVSFAPGLGGPRLMAAHLSSIARIHPTLLSGGLGLTDVFCQFVVLGREREQFIPEFAGWFCFGHVSKLLALL
jgi:hypothetical protein